MLSYDELTPPERELWDAFPEGRRVDLRTGVPEDDRVAGGAQWGPARTVRAAVIAALLLGANPPRPGAVAGLRLTGARVSGHLDLAGAQIGHVLWIEECWFEGSVNLLGASTQSLMIAASRVPGLEAGSAVVEGHLDLRRSVVESGAPSPFHHSVTALSLTNSRVAGGVILNGTELSAPGGWALAGGGVVVEGGFFCQVGFVARGEVRLPGAQLTGGLFMKGARLEQPATRGVALAMDNATVTTLDLSAGFTASGTVRLRGTRIVDNLTFEGAVLNGPPDGDGPALVGMLMRAVDFDLTLARPPSGAVDLRGAQVSYLHEGEHSWPDVVELDGFVYGSVKVADAEHNGERREAVGARSSVAHRIAWIRRSPGYSPQPYEQLASWYRTVGHDDDARRVLLAKQRHRRRTLRPAARAWGHLLDTTVGYGYRPWLAGVWLLALTLLGTLVFRAHSPTPVKPGEGAPFQPFVYTLDLLIPIGGLGQRTSWYWTDDGAQWLAYALVALGWVLTTAVIAGVTRTLQKN
ncbi:oxidoreductase [Streptomyces cyaneochromogenes]|uniref:Oxidoreductase n=1 Tax=Streptomyces cyaneochromogenes TaxID=2496836 RepID=A0A3Q9ESG8_9ACTN|nr:oxidoreductase [Streptomyces cyaneochromogenes]AZQ34963.1 oxidoreductase [Streptomyces cyaneochromogenes]